MKLIIKKTEKISGTADIPSSKSHSIRAIVFSSLAEGTSNLSNILESDDIKAAINACSSLGAKIEKKGEGAYQITGFNGMPIIINDNINTLNSGTTTNLIASVAALANKKITIDGDESIRKRPVQPLLSAINSLGAEALSLKNNGCPPMEITGRMKGGRTALDCRSSQYLSSLLISCPLLEQDTEIEIQNICEKPYIELTMKWLDELKIRYKNHNFEKINIYGNQKYFAFKKTIPADWSSATFLLVAGAMIGENMLIKGLDMKDTQADMKIIDYLRKMGANIQIKDEGILINKSELTGCELDLNNTPDALPAIAVLACYAKGRTIIKNVAHARIKETDRINVMAKELRKMGAEIEEMNDGMIIEQRNLKGAKLNGYGDHRVVMALSIAGMVAKGNTEIDTAESVSVTFPDYVKLMKDLGAKIEII